MNAPGSLLGDLLRARESGSPFALDPALRPGSEEEAYATAACLVHHLGLRPNGYKIGANTAQGQKALGLAQPLYGRTFAERTQHSPGVFATRGGAVNVEVEIALRLSPDFDGALAASHDEWLAHVAQATWAIEINQPSYKEPMSAGGFAIIADNGVHAGLVLGEPIDLGRLGEAIRQPVSIVVNGGAVQGSAAASGIDPLAALDWLARICAARRQPVRGGDWICTGGIASHTHQGTGEVSARAGDRVVAALRLD